MGFFPLKLSHAYAMYEHGNNSRRSAELALEHVNARNDVLRDYTLEMIVLDSGDDEGVAVNSFFHELYEGGRPSLMVIGGLRNEITEILARPMRYWNLLQISYGSHSHSLSMSQLPNLFRTIPSSAGYNDPIVKMLELWGWDRVAIVSSTFPMFTEAVEDLRMKFGNTSINNNNDVIAYEKFNIDKAQPIKILKDKDARIIIGNFYEYDAIPLFCEAYKAGFYGPKYVWIIYGHYDPDWWIVEDGWVTCTPEEMTKAVEGYIGVKFETLSRLENKTVSGYTAEWYREKMLNETNVDLGSVTQTPTYAYDAVWAAALALNASIADITPETLDQFEYATGANMTEIFRKNLYNVNFLGVSGQVQFDHIGDRQGTYIISKNINGTNHDIGKYSARDNSMQWNYPDQFIWADTGGFPPPDEDIMVIEIDDVSMELFATMCAFSCVGIVMALGFLFFNVYFRNERLIKMSSPNLNDVIIAGCILSYVTVILLGIDTRVLNQNDQHLTVICQVRVWVFALSFTLSFGAMFSKTWRVYTIFTNKKVQKRVIKDHQLFVMVGVLLLIDVVILAAWQIIDPLTVSIKEMGEKVDPERDDVVIKIEQHNCWGKYDTYFIWALYIFKGLLLVFGAFITWQTRNVSIPALNDSKYIGLSIYNVVIFSALGVPMSYLLENTNYTYAVVTGLIVFCTTLTLCLLFFPKVVSIIYGYAPEDVGTRVMSNLNGRAGYSSGIRNGPNEERHRRLLAAKGGPSAAESSVSNVYDRERSTQTSEATRM
ncbi:gamma-aminobutyric acid type B receptor subunit 2-like [Amphiura filiformis]|uniref:gamma-aminobutyric acid type B receptor subunit 2-like n=1 Tax=Amphiura filiformis TaxID=82378 RepID=UPI003B21C822